MIVKIAFDPADLKAEDEACTAFNSGGLTLKIWALYKKHFVTSQHFRKSLAQWPSCLSECSTSTTTISGHT